jgi:hypothetical protein
VTWFLGRDRGHGQLSGLDRLRLGQPGKIYFPDQFGQCLGFKQGTSQPFLGAGNEYLVEGFNRQTMDLFQFRLSLHLAGLLSG